MQPLKPLMEAFFFTQSDLDSNRAGVMTPSQKQRLRRGFILVAGLILVPVALLTAGFLAFSFQPVRQIWLVRSLAIFTLGSLVVVWLWNQRRLRALNEGEVLQLDGRGHTSQFRSVWYFEPDSSTRIRFPISAEQARVIHADTRYRVYYLGQVKEILSIEPLQPSNP
jgi:hypothetical protein